MIYDMREISVVSKSEDFHLPISFSHLKMKLFHLLNYVTRRSENWGFQKKKKKKKNDIATYR